MSNLASAKISIEAEIIQSKKEISKLHAQVESLEETLSRIAALSGDADAKPVKAAPTGKRKAKADVAKPAKAAKPAKRAKQAKAAKGENDLPSTGGEYWPDLVTGHPQSASEILHAAIDKLKFTPTKDQIQKLTQRATFALNSLVKAGKLQDSGSGRERRFFKA